MTASMMMDNESLAYKISVIRIREVPASVIRNRLIRKNFSIFSDSAIGNSGDKNTVFYEFDPDVYPGKPFTIWVIFDVAH